MMAFRCSLIYMMLGDENKKVLEATSKTFLEVPSRVELLYTVLQTVT